MSAHGVAIIELVVNIGTWGHKFGFRNVFIQPITKVLIEAQRAQPFPAFMREFFFSFYF